MHNRNNEEVAIELFL